MAERQSNAEQERAVEAELRAASGHAAQAPKKRRGPADNMDPDIDL
jgi:translation initiation factor IF-3